jgi:D-alanyl-D-alanine dipeptidase
MPKRQLAALLCPVLAAAAAAMPARAQSCPSPLDSTLRLVLVTTPTMDSAAASMQLFTRKATSAPWTAATGVEPVVVGKAGLAWGYTFVGFKREPELEKFEGDKRTPAGFFRMGPTFGFSASDMAGHIVLRSNETVCVEDPVSQFYNTLTRREKVEATVKTDDMRRTPLYRNGIFVNYPSDRASRRGSCILVHIWQGPDSGTAGCVAMTEANVKAVQSFSQAGAVLAVLPRPALDRFSGCLPDPGRPNAGPRSN